MGSDRDWETREEADNYRKLKFPYLKEYPEKESYMRSYKIVEVKVLK